MLHTQQKKMKDSYKLSSSRSHPTSHHDRTPPSLDHKHHHHHDTSTHTTPSINISDDDKIADTPHEALPDPRSTLTKETNNHKDNNNKDNNSNPCSMITNDHAAHDHNHHVDNDNNISTQQRKLSPEIYSLSLSFEPPRHTGDEFAYIKKENDQNDESTSSGDRKRRSSFLEENISDQVAKKQRREEIASNTSSVQELVMNVGQVREILTQTQEMCSRADGKITTMQEQVGLLQEGHESLQKVVEDLHEKLQDMEEIKSTQANLNSTVSILGDKLLGLEKLVHSLMETEATNTTLQKRQMDQERSYQSLAHRVEHTEQDIYGQLQSLLKIIEDLKEDDHDARNGQPLGTGNQNANEKCDSGSTELMNGLVPVKDEVFHTFL